MVHRFLWAFTTGKANEITELEATEKKQNWIMEAVLR